MNRLQDIQRDSSLDMVTQGIAMNTLIEELEAATEGLKEEVETITEAQGKRIAIETEQLTTEKM